MAEPPLATLIQLQDGTYSIDDVELFNQMLKYKEKLRLEAESDG